MEHDKMKSALMAVLFASGEPIGADKLAEALETDRAAVEMLADELGQDIKGITGGICLIKLEDRYQLCTESEYMPFVKRAMEMKRNTPLSQAAMEVLAVICYNQPVTKSFVEQVRGVECSGVFTTLVEKGLIEERGRLERPGRPLIYGTTDVFLRCFNLPSLDCLPPLPRMDAVADSEQRAIDSIIEDESAKSGQQDETPPGQQDEKPERADAMPEDCSEEKNAENDSFAKQ